MTGGLSFKICCVRYLTQKWFALLEYHMEECDPVRMLWRKSTQPFMYTISNPLLGFQKTNDITNSFSNQSNTKPSVRWLQLLCLLQGVHDIIFHHHNLQQVSQGKRRGRGKLASKDLHSGPQTLGHSSGVLAQRFRSSSQQKQWSFGQGGFNSMHKHTVMLSPSTWAVLWAACKQGCHQID
jgi:hypothetical protein